MEGPSHKGDEKNNRASSINKEEDEESQKANSPASKEEAQEANSPAKEENELKSSRFGDSKFLNSLTAEDGLLNSVRKTVSVGMQKKRKSGDQMKKSKKKDSGLDSSSRNDAPPKRSRPPRLDEHVSYEEHLLSRTLEDAGHWAYGIVATELWIYDDENGTLFRPDGATWADMTLHPPHKTKQEYQDCPLCRTVDPNHPKFTPPVPLAPGVGIAGVLWAEAGKASDSQGEPDQDEDIYWRNLQALAQDPDQPYNERLQNAALTRLGWAGAVPFNVEGQRGLMVYLTRDSVNMDQLQSASNVRYLLAAAHYVSTVWALRLPRLGAIREREDRLRILWRRLRFRMIAVIRFGATLDDIRNGRTNEIKPDKKTGSLYDSLRDPKEMAQILMEEGKQFAERTVKEAKSQQKFIARKLKMMANKSRGANIRAPPVFSWEATLWSFVGTLVTLLILLNINEQIKKTYGQKYELTLGPLSSFTASVFVLTAAPASQPRNNLVAYSFAMVVGLCLAYITSLAVWIRQAISVSITVCAMVKFGFLHAPAAGVALTFASGSQNWSNVFSMVLASLIVITLGTIINNLSDKRQYPTSWGFRPLIKFYNRKIKGE
mmetsp:Transcript_28733/g.47562  ORF Transcript_28733/g.47562 Transcript_28733/m.47562 type:complete len:603 (-) Transcript_28733:147-1955(-)